MTKDEAIREMAEAHDSVFWATTTEFIATLPRPAFDLEAAVKALTYKPGWSFQYDTRDYGHQGVTVVAFIQDSANPEKAVKIYHDVRLLPPQFLTREIFLIEIRKVIEQIEQHEIDEWLRCEGKHANDPHPSTGSG